MNSSKKIKVLFVCMGNICRSPLACGMFHSVLEKYGITDKFAIDSAGTANYHIGDKPDSRACQVAKEIGIKLEHSARQFTTQDFKDFDYILVMDHLNYEAILNMSDSEEDHEKVFLFRTFDEYSVDYHNVPDPYYGAVEDFVDVRDIVLRASEGFIRYLVNINCLCNLPI